MAAGAECIAAAEAGVIPTGIHTSAKAAISFQRAAVIRRSLSLWSRSSNHDSTIHRAMPIMNRFSVSDTKPSGTLLDPPTQAHLISRFCT